MAVLDTEIKCYRSAIVSDASSNGGRLSSTIEADGLDNSLWPNVTEAQRTSGTTQYRKTFWKVENALDTELMNVKFFLERPTPGEDRLYFFAATQTDTQNDISSPNLYGAGSLSTAITAGDDHVHVQVEHGATTIFRDNDIICIADYTTAGVLSHEEYHVVNGAPSVNGSIHTVNLDSTVANSYTTSNTFVSSCLISSSVKATVDGKVVTSAAGTFNELLVTPKAIGGVEDTFTFTFTSSTAFSCSGTITGLVGTGNINSTFAPTNADFGSAYFSIPSAAWGGTWAINDTLALDFHPAALPVWEQRVVPASCGVIAAQDRRAVLVGESA